MTVVALVTPSIDKELQADAIEHLELALERVRRGETVSVAIAEVTADGGSYTHWSQGKSANAMLGAISRLWQKLGLSMSEAS